MLFRAEYLRDGKPRYMTFSRRNAYLAADYAYIVLASYIKSLDPKSEILNIIPLTQRGRTMISSSHDLKTAQSG